MFTNVIERYRSLADWKTTKYVKFVRSSLPVSFLLSFAFFVTFEIQVITQKVAIFYNANFIQFWQISWRTIYLFTCGRAIWISCLAWLAWLDWLTAQQTLGGIGWRLPVFNWVEFIFETERHQTSARYALVFCISFYWPRYTKRSKHSCTKTVCLWPRFTVIFWQNNNKAERFWIKIGFLQVVELQCLTLPIWVNLNYKIIQ